jgi:hypothetical protein
MTRIVTTAYPPKRPARRPRPVTYAEAMDALLDAYQTLHDLLDSRLGRNTREQLVLLRDRLARVVKRDDGRRR